ncbi:hypothetical protein DS745_15460 [Anaerobacillus alkaliphilus]|uniref:Phospholipid/glycerol acyltransferase domain-containing protein n=1 Tax=Anaerobacillus alkaliphilus TaxID=1548597 RepID=A0A4Q0VPE0_9BACI|nr:lysophospholipid acyltransferase family protein [Anaerobacillus alkaliphilus]RXI97765.1 hypothetical protein DS745_15460 [Anaerobacillus alkaliphilus]
MIEAKKSQLFSNLFHLYNQRLLKKTFHRISLKQAKSLPTIGPTLYIANHSSWWDGLLAFYLTRTVLKRDCYAMMTEVGLKAYPFFRKIGGYSINKDNPKDVIRSLAYTRRLLDLSKGIWVFPQGKEEHLEKRPLLFQPGVSRVIRQVNTVTVVPITFYYTFLHEQRPEVFISIGESLPAPRLQAFSLQKDLTTFLEDILTEQLNNQKQEVVNETFEAYDVIIHGKKSISKQIEVSK